MKIELRKISYNAALSEETYAFSADVWIDGAKAGTVKNAGHGGCHDFRPFDIEARVDAYAKTLPAINVSDLYRDGEKHEMEESAETLINGLVSTWLAERDLKRALARRILYTKVGEGTAIYQTKAMPVEVKERMLAQPEKIATAWKADKVLNLLPFDQALAIYRADPLAAP